MLSLVLRNTLRKFSSSCDSFQYSNSSSSNSNNNNNNSNSNNSIISLSSSSLSTSSTLSLLKKYKNFYLTKCDNDNDGDDGNYESGPSLIELADAQLENEKEKIHTPIQYDNIKHTLGQASANTFDGFRVVVQKQLNLNTIVNHMYWVGSQSVPPMHQYRYYFYTLLI